MNVEEQKTNTKIARDYYEQMSKESIVEVVMAILEVSFKYSLKDGSVLQPFGREVSELVMLGAMGKAGVSNEYMGCCGDEG